LSRKKQWKIARKQKHPEQPGIPVTDAKAQPPDYAVKELAEITVRGFAIAKRLEEAVEQEASDDSGFSYSDTLLCLYSEVMANFVRLFRACAEKQLPNAACAARGLLELSVWSKYCCRSRENARKFRDDALRDFAGLVDAAAKLTPLVPHDASDPALVRSVQAINEAKVEVQKIAQTAEIDLDETYKRVRQAAKDLGSEDLTVFEACNVGLSKLLHPTALSVNTTFEIDLSATLLEFCFRTGAVFARIALDELDTVQLGQSVSVSG
jgi:hypothetical protein